MSEIVEFDYSLVTKDVEKQLLVCAAAIRKHCETHVASALDIGKKLSEARAMLDNETSFKTWVERECGFSRSTAYNYIAAHANFGGCPTVGHIEVSAMYQLAKSAEAKKEALKLAKKGIPVTQELAKELVADCRPEPPKRPPVNTDSPSDSEPASTAPKPRESTPIPAAEKPVKDRGKCPNCAGTKWTEGDDGWACSKCHHPHGEPVGDKDDDETVDERVSIARSKAVKTVEALLRAFDDLQVLASHPREHANAIATCKILLKTAKDWK